MEREPKTDRKPQQKKNKGERTAAPPRRGIRQILPRIELEPGWQRLCDLATD